MFEKLVMYIIESLEAILKELKRASIETFGDKRLMREFNEEVELRCNANKELFVRKAAVFVGKKVLEEEGYLIPPKQAEQIGEAMFEGAKNIGMIDILNNVIE